MSKIKLRRRNNPPTSPTAPPLASQQVTHIQESFFSGPLPSPQVLAGYESVCPGFAERVVTMAETEGAHRRTLEEQELQSDIIDRAQQRNAYRIGQILAFFIGVIALLVGGYTATHGGQIAGTFIGTSGVVGLVSAFLYTRVGFKSRQGTSHQ